MTEPTPTKFHKSFGNVTDEEISDGEIKLLQALIRDCEQKIIIYRLKEVKAAHKIEKIWNAIKEDKELAQESRQFVDEHPLFSSMCLASGITPEQGRRKFYKRVNDTLKRKMSKLKKRHAKEKKKIKQAKS